MKGLEEKMFSRFLKDSSIRDTILEAGLFKLMAAAEARDATCGVGGAAIVYEGRMYPLYAPLHDDWSLAFDPEKQWPGEKEKGIDYLGYAMGKMAQSVRTHEPSTDFPITKYDFGESNDVGSFCETISLEDGGSFEFHAVYSGMESNQDKASSIESVSHMQVLAGSLTLSHFI